MGEHSRVRGPRPESPLVTGVACPALMMPSSQRLHHPVHTSFICTSPPSPCFHPLIPAPICAADLPVKDSALIRFQQDRGLVNGPKSIWVTPCYNAATKTNSNVFLAPAAPSGRLQFRPETTEEERSYEFIQHLAELLCPIKVYFL